MTTHQQLNFDQKRRMISFDLDSGVATSPKQPRLICTSNQPGPHEVETGDDIQKEQSNSSIRTTFARSTQATQASDRTTQIPNTIPGKYFSDQHDLPTIIP